MREYRTVRIATVTKYWLNRLIDYKEQELEKHKYELISEYEEKLKEHSDFGTGYSVSLSITVTSGSILEAAFHYVKNSNIDWNTLIDEMEKSKCDIENFDIGTLTPRFYLYEDVWKGLEDLRHKLKPSEMLRGLQLNYVIKLVIFAYYKKIFSK